MCQTMDRISYEIKELVETHRQSNEVFKRKKMLRQIIYNMLRVHTEFPVDLYMVGSSLNGLGTNNSDIDLCLVIDSIGEKMCHMRFAIPVLKWAERILSRLPFVKNTKLILAKVPILKFTDSESGIEIDLNFNNIVGIRNTQLIEFYNRMDKRFQSLVLTAKIWARQNGINNARFKTISSYTIVLMVIHYLQCGCDPPVLPCLHDLMPDKFHPDSDITKLSLFEEIPEWQSSNKSSLSQLFIGFLDYYSYKFDYVSNAISIRTGSTISKAKAREHNSPKNNPKHWNYICVEEPFDRTNTAKSVYDEEAFNHILDVFRQSYAKIIKTQTLSSIILNISPSLSTMSCGQHQYQHYQPSLSTMSILLNQQCYPSPHCKCYRLV
ncbi:poly(A) RNA polymerase gld-2 homolog A [Tetranychus urticae]|uniref:Uncharacterized protein n=1 Tax=Tetranychus urticae TaxID=32264 RepID=T1KNB2_TETUR|nr:poly(A) RNA polymerase gld-2 homolog A [Tetranychus urticae]XP_015788988.1 poly(A) RNA polymerase gld-2 homolog A [Tetranychus urticae]